MSVVSKPSSPTEVGETDMSGLVVGEDFVAGTERLEDDRKD